MHIYALLGLAGSGARGNAIGSRDLLVHRNTWNEVPSVQELLKQHHSQHSIVSPQTSEPFPASSTTFLYNILNENRPFRSFPPTHKAGSLISNLFYEYCAELR